MGKKKTGKGTLSKLALAVTPFGLSGCSSASDKKLNTNSMILLGKLEEFIKSPFQKQIDY